MQVGGKPFSFLLLPIDVNRRNLVLFADSKKLQISTPISMQAKFISAKF